MSSIGDVSAISMAAVNETAMNQTTNATAYLNATKHDVNNVTSAAAAATTHPLDDLDLTTIKTSELFLDGCKVSLLRVVLLREMVIITDRRSSGIHRMLTWSKPELRFESERESDFFLWSLSLHSMNIKLDSLWTHLEAISLSKAFFCSFVCVAAQCER